MIFACDVIGRTQQGNNNAYCQDNEVSWVDWSRAGPNADLVAFTAALSDFRRAHPAFRRRRFFAGQPGRRDDTLGDIAWFSAGGTEMADADWVTDIAHCLMVFLNGQAITDVDTRGERVTDGSFLLCFNAAPEDVDMVLPSSDYGQKWAVVLDTATGEVRPVWAVWGPWPRRSARSRWAPASTSWRGPGPWKPRPRSRSPDGPWSCSSAASRPRTPPASTYRVQLGPNMTFPGAAELIPYLRDLGVGAMYTSPVLAAAPGSTHGYDVVDPTKASPALGGQEAFTRLADALRDAGLGLVADIVPNHMGIAVPAANPAWWDVLRLGRESPYARFFDIDWDRAPIMVPVLADAGAVADLTIIDGQLAYHDLRFPIAPGTGGGTPQQVHERQHYRLADWRRANSELNYRRFFDVTTLAAVRVEDPEVFEATHAVLGWVAAGQVTGLRVDHPDGLADPGLTCGGWRRRRRRRGWWWRRSSARTKHCRPVAGRRHDRLRRSPARLRAVRGRCRRTGAHRVRR